MGPCPRPARATAAAAAAASERESDKKQRQRALLTRCPPNKDEQFRVGPYLNAGGGCGCHQSFEACGVGRRGPACRSALVALALCVGTAARDDRRSVTPLAARRSSLWHCVRGRGRARRSMIGGSALTPQAKHLCRATVECCATVTRVHRRGRISLAPLPLATTTAPPPPPGADDAAAVSARVPARTTAGRPVGAWRDRARARDDDPPEPCVSERQSANQGEPRGGSTWSQFAWFYATCCRS